ncbi:DUF4190 domain-containing protein [Microbacterium elymi]|uniref:DUF4190 domain-containing protein n=1 Tax=Microbacterium elymi TaxID=2909587 RepID=A0ABY5NIS4_9MICO|nr:DUF4190 domain-containing protein [Microbacterium elymi]UUT35082.1 DUF4190 domain-containing protein [Microbacterium elymi]
MLGIVAFICSLAGLVTGITALVGLVLGIIAMVQSKKAGQKNGFALAAIIIGAILVVLSIIGLIIAIAFFASLAAATQACLVDPTTVTNVFGIPFDCSGINRY